MSFEIDKVKIKETTETLPFSKDMSFYIDKKEIKEMTETSKNITN